MHVHFSIDVVNNLLRQLDVFVKILNLGFENLNSLGRALVEVSETDVLLEDVFEHEMDSDAPHAGALTVFFSEPLYASLLHVIHHILGVT